MKTTRSYRRSFTTPKEIMVTPIYMGTRKQRSQQQQPENDEPSSPVNNRKRQSLYPSFKQNSSIVQDLERLEIIQALWGINSNMLPTISPEEALIDQDVDDLVVNFMYIPPTRRRGSSSSSPRRTTTHP